MKIIIDNNHYLGNKLKGGVDVLITPHHGLQSSFSTYLFDNMKDKKTRSLNIVSEKASDPDGTRFVDTRYSSSEYCMGRNNLSGRNGVEKCYQVKTSRGHILIDYNPKSNPFFKICSNINDAINFFVGKM